MKDEGLGEYALWLTFICGGLRKGTELKLDELAEDAEAWELLTCKLLDWALWGGHDEKLLELEWLLWGGHTDDELY